MIISNESQIQTVIDFIDRNDELAYDIETTSLNPRTGAIVGIGISTATEGYYLLQSAWNGEALEDVLSKDTITAILNKLKSKKLYGWNFSFDSRFTYHFYNVDLIESVYCDGMLAKHTADENAFSYALKETAAALYGNSATKEQQDMQASIKANGGTTHEYYKADATLLGLYCLQDCKLTLKISQHYLNLIENDGLTNFFLYEEVMPLYKHVTIPMELKGIPLDVTGLKATYKEICEDIQALETQIQSMIKPLLGDFETWFMNKDYAPKVTGPFAQAVAELCNVPLPKLKSGSYSFAAKHIAALPDGFFKDWLEGRAYLPAPFKVRVQRHMHGDKPMFNLQSKHHLKKLFFEKMNLEATSFTDLGSPQVDESFLESIKEKIDFVPLLITFNKLNKIKGTYYERFLERQENGIFYQSIFQHRTVSGRQASDLQQLPRQLKPGKDVELVVKYTNKIRDFLIAGPSKVLIGADYESLEPHIFSHVAGDKKLQDIFNKGHDFYSTIAIDTEGLDLYSADKNAENYLGKLNPEIRQNSKEYALGIPYGLGGFKLQFTLKIPLKDAERLVKNYLNAYPALHSWMKTTAMQAYTTGKVRTETGRLRRFPRAIEIYKKYGANILDDLELWKAYNETPDFYRQAKRDRREFKNYINNANNFQIQGLAASIVSQASIAISKEFKKRNLDAYITMLVHDEIVALCSEQDSGLVSNIMKETMENIYKLSVKLKTEPKVGRKYSDTK